MVMLNRVPEKLIKEKISQEILGSGIWKATDILRERFAAQACNEIIRVFMKMLNFFSSLG